GGEARPGRPLPSRAGADDRAREGQARGRPPRGPRERAADRAAARRASRARGRLGPAQAVDHGEAELGGPLAVDDAVVEGDRDVADPARDDLAVAHDRAVLDPVDAEDRNLRVE